VYTPRGFQDLWEQRRFRTRACDGGRPSSWTVELPGFRWGEGRGRIPGGALVRGGRACGAAWRSTDRRGWAAHGHRRDGAARTCVGGAARWLLRRDRFVEPPRDPALSGARAYLHGTLPASAAGGAEAPDARARNGFAERRSRWSGRSARSGGRGACVPELWWGSATSTTRAATNAELGGGVPAGPAAEGARAGARALRSAAGRCRGRCEMRNVASGEPSRAAAGGGRARFLAAERPADLEGRGSRRVGDCRR